MINILVTGSNGQLGSEIQKIAPAFPELQFVCTDVDVLDITNAAALDNFCDNKGFEFIINCAAYTAVDKAESDLDLAYKINRDAVKNLATVASKYNATLIHVSTDYVFDGTSCRPYVEDDVINPQSAYGKTKAEGESEALKYNKSIVIRTSWLYSSFGANFVKTMMKLGSERSEVKVIFDQVGTPTYAEDLASAILSIVRFTKTKELKTGIYHFSDEGACSWYDFAFEIMSLQKYSCSVKPIESKDYPSIVKRPFYSVLNKSKIKSTFAIEIPHWKTSLYRCLTELNSKK
jgi:dTDP-4-dehydrorhamnose reductase